MYYFFYGEDTQKVRTKVRDLVKTLLTKKPNAAHIRLIKDNFTEDSLTEYSMSQGLFSERAIIVLDSLIEESEYPSEILSSLKMLAESENVFVLLERKPDAKTRTRIEKYAEKTQEFALEKKEKKDAFNIFSLTDALGERNKKRLWTRYQEALRAGSAPEEIHGILFWQLKTLLLVSKGATAGIKPFVITKAKHFLGNYTENELEDLTKSFVDLYHDARRGKIDFDIGLEKILLSL